jgi:hypothetical protein
MCAVRSIPHAYLYLSTYTSHVSSLLQLYISIHPLTPTYPFNLYSTSDPFKISLFAPASYREIPALDYHALQPVLFLTANLNQRFQLPITHSLSQAVPLTQQIQNPPKTDSQPLQPSTRPAHGIQTHPHRSKMHALIPAHQLTPTTLPARSTTPRAHSIDLIPTELQAIIQMREEIRPGVRRAHEPVWCLPSDLALDARVRDAQQHDLCVAYEEILQCA